MEGGCIWSKAQSHTKSHQHAVPQSYQDSCHSVDGARGEQLKVSGEEGAVSGWIAAWGKERARNELDWMAG